MLLDLLIYTLLTRTSDFFQHYYLLAAFVAFIISASNSYIWNKRWTFKDKVQFTHTQLIKFYIASAIALSINETVLWILVRHLGIFDIVAKLMASISAGGMNFVLQKFWIFRLRAIKPETPMQEQ